MNRVNELAAWDFAEEFTAMEAVGLILGVGSHQSLSWGEKEPIYKRMKQAFDYANGQLPRPASDDISFGIDGKVEIPSPNPLNLHSLRNEKARTLLELDVLALAIKEEIDEAVFSREEIHRWLKSIDAKSQYSFSLSEQASEIALDDKTQKVEQAESEIDPIDLPLELDAANMAHRAITNGYGDQSDTARNRLITYLQSTHPYFKKEQVQRIATVANPDKTPGRKKNEKK